MGIRFSPGPCGCCIPDVAIFVREGANNFPSGVFGELELNGHTDLGSFTFKSVGNSVSQYYYFLATQPDAAPGIIFPAQWNGVTPFQVSTQGNAALAQQFHDDLVSGINQMGCSAAGFPNCNLTVEVALIAKVGGIWQPTADILGPGLHFFPPDATFSL